MRKSRAALTMAAMTAAAFLVGGANAQAAVPAPTVSAHATKAVPRGDVTPMDQTCPLNSGLACFWSGISRSGAKGEVAGNNADFNNVHNSSGCTHFPGTWNDCIRSAANGGSKCDIYFWTGAGYTGRYHSLGMGDSMDAFGISPWNDPSFADAISSDHWCTAR
jgi:Peptidase inhibitor family I36